MQIQIKKKFFLRHTEKLIFLCCCDSLWDYSYKNAICRNEQTCLGGKQEPLWNVYPFLGPEIPPHLLLKGLCSF